MAPQSPEVIAANAWHKLALEPPVNLYVVSEHLGAVVQYDYLYNDNLAFYVRTPEGQHIIHLAHGMNTQHLRWLWSHELGHVVYNWRRPGPLRRDSHAVGAEERWCDHFARALLMPEAQLRAECERLHHPQYNRLGSLKEIFNVHADIMGDRLRELRLLRG